MGPRVRPKPEHRCFELPSDGWRRHTPSTRSPGRPTRSRSAGGSTWSTDSGNTTFEVLLATSNLAIIAAGLFVVRDSYRGEKSAGAGRWLRDHVSAALITYLLGQYAALLIVTSTGQNLRRRSCSRSCCSCSPRCAAASLRSAIRCTVTVVLIDRTAKRATIASAGHPPVILRRPDGTLETIDLYAPPLGVRLPVSIPQRTIGVAPGDVFVLHSDGVHETRGPDDEVYGFDRLEAVIRGHDGSAESLRDVITADVDRFRGSAVPGDDVTVVVAKVV